MLTRLCRRCFCTVTPRPWLFVGLGNPGGKYKGTRHNVGFEMIDAFAESQGIPMNTVHSKAIFGKGFVDEVPVFLAKPQTYMNLSGESMKGGIVDDLMLVDPLGETGPLAAYYKLPLHQVLVFHDDMNLPCGVLRLHDKGGHGSHKGLKSVMSHFRGNREFPRLRIGIGRPPGQMDPKAFLLQKFNVTARQRMERLAYEVVVEDGKFFYKQSGELLHTTGEDAHDKWIFVLSTSKTLYVGKKTKGSFQHSSFLAGGATSSAGRLVVEHGVLKAVWPHSGHYRPTEENFKEFISFLQENKVSLSDVKMAPVDEVDELRSLRSSGHLRSHSSEEDFSENINGLETQETIVQDSVVEKANLMETDRAAFMAPNTRQFQMHGRELSKLEIPKRGQVFEALENEKGGGVQSCGSLQMESHTGGQETFVSELDHTISKKNLSDDNDVETIPQESILKRINSHKEMKSYQLGKQLSCKWTTGAGPRIGCVRDYPCELQFRALEQVNLSPRSRSRSKSSFAPRTTTPLSTSLSTGASLFGDTTTEPQLEYKNMSQSQRGESNANSQFSPLIRGTSVIPVIHMS